MTTDNFLRIFFSERKWLRKETTEGITVIMLSNMNFTYYLISNIYFSYITMNNHPLIKPPELISSITIINWNFNQVSQSSSTSLFKIGVIGSITFNNNTFIDISGSILSISKIDLSLGMNSQISNMLISNSSATAITFGNFINPTSAVQTLLVENITYSNSTIDEVIDFINTENIISMASVTHKILPLSFRKWGRILRIENSWDTSLPKIIFIFSFLIKYI